MISRQEHEAWDALLACQGQLRLAPSGHVIGIDVNAALRIGATRSCDLAALSKLLPAAEVGLIQALCSERVREDGLDRAPAMPAEWPLAAVSTHPFTVSRVCFRPQTGFRLETW